jgi:hypothetical protein
LQVTVVQVRKVVLVELEQELHYMVLAVQQVLEEQEVMSMPEDLLETTQV